MKKIFFLIFILIISLISIANAKEVVIDNAKGKVKIVDGDEKKARDEARTEALIDAVRQATGVIISVETTAKDFTEVEEIIKAKTNGEVKSFEPLVDETVGDTYMFVARVVIEVPDEPKEEEEIDDNDLFFQISDGVLYKYDGNETIVTIPEKVKKIDKGVFANNTNIRKVILPKNIKYLGDEAFKNCENLRDINLEDSITYIGKSCFFNCHSLTEAIIPKGVQIIEESSFRYCYNLEKIIIPNGVIEIKDFAFCAYYYEVNGTEVIEFGQVAKKDLLIHIPSSVEIIGEYCFFGHNSKELIIENGLRIIGKQALDISKKLNKLIIPRSVEQIGASAFPNTNELIIENGVSKIDDDAFRFYSIKKLKIPQSVKTIGKSAFYYCNDLEELIIENGVEKINDYAFCCLSTEFGMYPNKKLTKLIIPGSVKFIGNESFSNYTNISELIFEEGVQAIGYKTFMNYKKTPNEKLKTLTFPKSLTYIGEEAFKGYKELKDVYLYKSTKKEKNSFERKVKFHYLDE